MTGTMTSEIFWLTLTTLYTALLVFPYAVYRINKLGGFWQVFLNPLPGDDPFDEEWAHRAYRSHMNAFENLILFAPLAIGVHVTGSSNEVTAMSCAVFFWARFLHAPLYIFNVPVVRTAVYFVGLGACFVLGYQLLT